MKTLLKPAVLFISSIFLINCTSHRPLFTDVKENQTQLVSYDAYRRALLVKTDGTGDIKNVLAEVQPDAALTNAIEVISKLETGEGLKAEQVTRITESITELGKRTAAVNILRDALYRLEEHCFNQKSTEGASCSTEYWKRFDTILAVVKEIQIADQDQAKAEKQKADNEAMELKNTANQLRAIELQQIKQ